MNEAQMQDQAPNQTGRGRPNRRGKGGYSLMEILIVLAIMGMLVAIVGPKMLGFMSGAKLKAAHAQMVTLKQALEAVNLDIGRYPSDQEGLSLLAASPGGGVANWNGPYMDRVPKDPWGNDFVYNIVPGGEPKITSLGADGKPGGTGNDSDITSD